MMSKFERFSLELSEFFGVEIEIANIDSISGDFELRFKDLEAGSTFYFSVYRNFSSTSIKLVADKFGKNSLIVIEDAILDKLNDVKKYVKEFHITVGKLDFKLGNKQIQDISNNSLNELHGVHFEAKVFTEESNMHFGILNKNEIELIYFTIKLFLIFLTVKTNGFISPDEAVGYPEGATTMVMVNKYERSPRNRKLCIEHFGLSCLGCGFNFSESYGELGEEYIIVHHIVPVSKIGPDYIINPKKDLIPLCANCHAIVHRKDPPLTLDELKKLTNYA